MEIGKKIRDLRVAKGITQEILAEVLSVTPQAVSKWETGSAAPDIQLLPELAVYFGVTIDELFCLTDDREFDRIQNMIWDSRLVPQNELERAERWLKTKIDVGYRPAACWRLLADLYNHQARMLHTYAADFARAALNIDPEEYEALQELNEAMGGYISDYNCRNHHRLIDELKARAEERPDLWRIQLWLLDNLIADHRLEEAAQWLDRLSRVHDSYRILFYRAMIARAAGDRQEFEAQIRKIEEQFADQWSALFDLGSLMADDGRYDFAVNCYRRAMELQSAPRYVDPLEAMAHIYEIQGDRNRAIAIWEEELRVLAEDWNTTAGETADAVHREIRRLRG